MGTLRKAVFHPSFPGAFKSWYAHEGAGWSATLKVDFDVERTRPDEAATRAVARYLTLRGVEIEDVRAYTTRKGWHLRVWMRETRRRGSIAAKMICDLQAQLGDDPYRVEFNRARIAREQAGWNVLWTEKYRNGRLISAETFDHKLTNQFRTWFGMAPNAP